jgi:hypothetical protein
MDGPWHQTAASDAEDFFRFWFAVEVRQSLKNEKEKKNKENALNKEEMSCCLFI